MAEGSLTRTVDERSRMFGPFGLGGPLPTTISERFVAEQMDALALPGGIPAAVRAQFDDLKATFRDGLFRYEAFTAAERDSYRVVEVALKTRFLEHYSAGLPVVVRGRHESREVGTFDAVFELLAVRNGAPTLADHPDFDGSLRSLVSWARRERYFYGQRNRLREGALVELRNSMQHSEHNTLVMPPDAFRSIHHTFELVCRLWEFDPQPGRAYPGLQPRVPHAVGLGPGSGEATCFDLAHTAMQINHTIDSRTWYVVLAVEDSGLLYWRDSDEEVLSTPTRRLWGPGVWRALKASVHENDFKLSVDSVELLDRLFYIRMVDGEPDLPRTAESVLRMSPRTASERWIVIRADSPSDAQGHIRHGARLNEQGICEACPAEVVVPLARRETIDRFIQDGAGAIPQPRHR